MDSKDKQKQVARHQQDMKKMRSQEERQANAQASRQRKAGRAPRKRERQDWGDYDEEDPFEDFEAIEHGRPGYVPPAASAALPHPWIVVDTGPHQVTVAKGEKRRQAHVGGTPLPQGRPVVGDRALLEELAHGEARLRSIAPRRSRLERRDPGNAHRSKLLAVNVEVALLVATAGPKGLRHGLLDRLRIAVESGEIQPVVVLSKLDLLAPEERASVQAQLAELRQDGLQAIAASAVSGEGCDELLEVLRGRIAVAVGPSGAGKSTLLNRLDPEHVRATGAVREDDQRGRHTTTAAAMHPFGEEGWLIDTPGVREFGVVGVDAAELLEAFPRLHDLAQDCPRGCRHRDDPACALAVAAAVDPKLAREYRSLLRLFEDLP